MSACLNFFIRKYSSSKSFSYITTPIYYVNAEPHIGHLYSSVIADAIKRWHQLLFPKNKILFATGTDEHGAKIQIAAKNNNISLINYCDNISSKYRHLSDTFSINYDDYIRTTEERHKLTVEKFWTILLNKDLIYKSTYKGWYCVSDETFLSNSQLIESEKDGKKILVSSESGHPVEWSEESNYIFKLSAFRNDLIYWLKQNETAVVPHKFYKILLDWVQSEDAVADISVSRPFSRVYWGIPVPNDPDQSVYVWLDALINYLTVAGYTGEENNFKRIWPPDIQVIGKDILKFHGIYWPAFLMAAGLEPPRSLLCHSHWTVDGEKMSKSKGNVVNPMEKLNLFTADGLRYFLLREGVHHSDGNYSNTKILRLLNAELADTLGNLLSRCCGKSLNPNQIFPKINRDIFNEISRKDVTKRLLESIGELPDMCKTHFNNFHFYKAADHIIATLHLANLFFESLKPWELKKEPSKIDELYVVLHLTMETLRVTGILLQPFIPNISESLLTKLNIRKDERFFDNLSEFSWNNEEFETKPLGVNSAVLFKRIIFEDERKAQKN